MLTLLATTTLLLASCGSNKSAKTTSNSSSKARSVSVSKKNSEKKASSIALEKKQKSESKAKADSQSKAESESKSKIAAPSSNMQNSQSTSSSSISSSASQSSQVQSSSSSSASYDENTLTDFLNKYGMSPSAYKMEHQGMSEYDALKNTPDNMKDSGEIQTEHMMDQGYLDHNGQATGKTSQQNSGDSVDTTNNNVDY